jgi:hypothetical protein
MLPKDLLYDECTRTDHCYGIMKTYRCIAMFLKILHKHCVLIVITSSSFIGFFHMGSDWKA